MPNDRTTLTGNEVTTVWQDEANEINDVVLTAEQQDQLNRMREATFRPDARISTQYFVDTAVDPAIDISPEQLQHAAREFRPRAFNTEDVNAGLANLSRSLGVRSQQPTKVAGGSVKPTYKVNVKTSIPAFRQPSVGRIRPNNRYSDSWEYISANMESFSDGEVCVQISLERIATSALGTIPRIIRTRNNMYKFRWEYFDDESELLHIATFDEDEGEYVGNYSVRVSDRDEEAIAYSLLEHIC